MRIGWHKRERKRRILFAISQYWIPKAGSSKGTSCGPIVSKWPV